LVNGANMRFVKISHTLTALHYRMSPLMMRWMSESSKPVVCLGDFTQIFGIKVVQVYRQSWRHTKLWCSQCYCMLVRHGLCTGAMFRNSTTSTQPVFEMCWKLNGKTKYRTLLFLAKCLASLPKAANLLTNRPLQ
jgi:hypothetical protein